MSPERRIPTDADPNDEERDPRQRDSGFLWLQEELGEKWWQSLGFDSGDEPGMLQTTQIILTCLELPVDTSRMTVIIEGWLSGDQSQIIVESHDDIPNTRFVNNKISAMKRKLRRIVDPENAYATQGTVIGNRAQDWLIDVYGVNWWKKFGFESEKTVVLGTLVKELFSRLQVAETSPELAQQFAEWISGETLLSIAGNNKAATRLGEAMRRVKDELSDMETVAKLQQQKAVERRIPTDVGRRSVASAVRVASQERPVREPGLADKWADRLGLNERMSKDLVRYLHPHGAVIIDRDMYQAVQHLTGYITKHFKSLGSNKFEMSDDQRDMLREILGINRNERTSRPGMPTYQSVARFIRDFPQLVYGYMPESERIGQVAGAFQAVLDADTARIERIQQR